MITYDLLFKSARLKECKIGIGNHSDSSIITESIDHCLGLGIGPIQSYSTSSDLIKALADGQIHCAVRGDLHSREMIHDIKSVFNVKTIKRAVMLKTQNENLFMLAPVGIDDTVTIDDRIELVRLLSDWLGIYSVTPRIAVLSGSRLDDRGRSEKIDNMLDEAQILTENIRNLGYDVNNYGILIEDALPGSNIILAPDGIIGNYIFRTFYHLGNGDSLGAPILNIQKTIIDTSRSKKEYSSAMILAASFYNLSTGN